MPVTIDVVDSKNSVIEKMDLREEIFDADIKQHLIHKNIVEYMTLKRRGTASCKTRSDVRGGGAKPFKQKGTGRARAGSIRTPLKRGGGVIFGPHPRDYKYKISKKERVLAVKSLLTDKIQSGNLVILDKIELETSKTKGLLLLLKDLGIIGKVLFVISGENQNLEFATRNLQNINVLKSYNLNAYALIDSDKVVCSKASVGEIFQ